MTCWVSAALLAVAVGVWLSGREARREQRARDERADDPEVDGM